MNQPKKLLTQTKWMKYIIITINYYKLYSSGNRRLKCSELLLSKLLTKIWKTL